MSTNTIKTFTTKTVVRRSALMTTLACSLMLVGCGDNQEPYVEPPPPPPPPPPAPFVVPTPIAVPLSAAGPDALQSVAAAPGGGFFAAGFAAETTTSSKYVVVAKLTAAGALDASFGDGGIFTSDVVFVGGNDEIDVAVQSSGKVVVSATVAHVGNASDRDVALLRVTTSGELDPDFGSSGVARVDLNTAHDNGSSLVGLDAVRGLALDGSDRIYLHAAQRGEGDASGGGPRTDTDFAVVRLTADGVLDNAFGGGDGKFLLDIQESNATPRGIQVLDSGEILAGGYANSPGIGSVQAVLYKLSATGALVPEFATGGLFHELVLAVQTEIYGFAVHGDQVVTAGYGRDSGDQNDWVSMRFSATDGTRDLLWGGGGNGVVQLDPSGDQVGDNCRNAVALPNGKTVLLGSSGPNNEPAQDAAFAVLDGEGNLDPAYAGTAHLLALGDDGNDQWWGGAASATEVMLAGYQGGGASAAQNASQNDDAYVLVFPVR